MAKDDELSLDLGKVTDFFKKVDKKQFVMWALLIAVIALVFWVRMVPADLPVTDKWAQQSIDNSLRQQLGAGLQQQYPNLPADSRNQMLNSQIAQYKEQNADQIELAKQQMSQQLKGNLRYEGDNGEQYTYLGDLDSYFWLRYTRNWLETGMTCDEVIDGQCMDMYQLAPVGVPMDRNPSLHVFAIGWLYKLITLFDPGYPLPAASYLVPVLAGMLGVIPAFFIGRRLAGNVGGVFSATLISLHPLVLSRSLGSDNDAWNIVIPLFILWMAIEAFEAKSWRSKGIFAGLAGLFVGLHAATWSGGWWFIYLIMFLGILGTLVYRAIRHAFQEKSYEVWRSKDVQSSALIFGIFYVSSFIFTMFSFSPFNYLRLPLRLLAGGAGIDTAVAASYWPNVLTTVAELNNANILEAINSMGGKLFFFAALLGMILMLLPRDGWKWEHWGVFAIAAAFGLYLVNSPPTNRLYVLLLLMIPIGLILIYYLFRKEDVKVADALIVLVWFLASVYATYNGVRFILLMVPAYGIAFGVLAGRIYYWMTKWIDKEFSWNKTLTYILVFVILALVLIKPVQSGYDTAANFVPSIDDGWWDSLTKIRENTEPDSIINSWWDFGHWFKYVADRRVSADGTSQHTHVPRWLGLALVTDDERQSVGTLRMLNCGSDTHPQFGGEQGAYGKTVSITQDPIQAERIVRNLTTLDEPEARQFLEQEGFGQDQAQSIMASTHCESPDDYLITSGDMVNKAGVWAHFGLWDFERAYIVAESSKMPRNEAVDDLMERFGYTEARAENIYLESKRLQNEQQRNAWIAPWPGYYPPYNWVGGCQQQANSSLMTCNLNLGISQQGNQVTAIDRIIVDLNEPTNSTIVVGGYANGQRLGGVDNGTIDLLVIARDELEQYDFSDPTIPNMAVLLDVPNKRVLLADNHLVTSVFTQLFFLDGRYNEHFEKFDERTTFSGSKIITWKVDWDGKGTSTEE